MMAGGTSVSGGRGVIGCGSLAGRWTVLWTGGGGRGGEGGCKANQVER